MVLPVPGEEVRKSVLPLGGVRQIEDRSPDSRAAGEQDGGEPAGGVEGRDLDGLFAGRWDRRLACRGLGSLDGLAVANPGELRGVQGEAGERLDGLKAGNRWPAQFSRSSVRGSIAAASWKRPMAVRTRPDITAAVPSDSARSRPSERI